MASHCTLAATIARAEQRHDDAVALLRKAADTDDEFGNDPPLFGGGARLVLAGALLDAGKPDDASKEIAEAMRLNGPSAWTHQGLSQLAELRGTRAESQRHAELARQAWKNAEGASLSRL
jgi:tetratricopeptide (TPR) repeat protein